ncbi:MAG: HepT-like ribonuclease domain-containing protein [Terriglobales bacterium]
MKACCERVMEYTAGLSREDFLSRRLVYDATLRNLELLGEAARNVPEDARALAPDVPWRRIVGVRNVLIHGYLGIDDDIIWDIVSNEVGKLRTALEKLEAEHPASGG